jgi:hypothetical protein
MVLVPVDQRKAPIHSDFAQEVMHAGVAPRSADQITMGLNFQRELACPLLCLPVASRHIIGVQPQPRA